MPAATYGMTGAPGNAGMAAARGEDGGEQVILVAWGGMRAKGALGDETIHYAYNAGTNATPTPTWVSTTATGVGPAKVANAS